ncbi:MAG: VOC family protein [Flavobacterium sp.]|nr:MAG: VOC family protein [Flavobacterium sp.]
MSGENKRKAENEADSHESKETKCEGAMDFENCPAIQLSPYLYFNGNCQEAVDFYVKVFDGKIDMIQKYGNAPDGGPDAASKDLIMHASISIDGTKIMFSDHSEEMLGSFNQGSNVHLSYFFKDHGRQRKVFAALSEGGNVTMPLANQFWNSFFGTVTDKFGVHWMLSGPPAAKEDESEAN